VLRCCGRRIPFFLRTPIQYFVLSLMLRVFGYWPFQSKILAAGPFNFGIVIFWRNARDFGPENKGRRYWPVSNQAGNPAPLDRVYLGATNLRVVAMWDGLLTLVIGIVVIPIIVVRGLFRLAGLKRVEDVLPPPQRDGRTSSPRAN
jgi:hypothetical protein